VSKREPEYRFAIILPSGGSPLLPPVSYGFDHKHLIGLSLFDGILFRCVRAGNLGANLRVAVGHAPMEFELGLEIASVVYLALEAVTKD